MVLWLDSFPETGGKIIFPFFFISFILLADLGFSQQYFNQLEDTVYSPIWLNTQTIESGYAYSGNHYSVADSSMPYGFGIETPFPGNIQNKNSWLIVEGWVKSNRPNDHASFVTSVFKGITQVHWQKVDLAELLINKNEWFYFSDSILVPASITKDGYIKAYLWNNDRKDSIAIDDLKISCKKITDISYLPNIETVTSASASNYQLMYLNDFYWIFYNSKNDRLSIKSKSGEELINDIWYYTKQANNTMDEVAARFILKKLRKRKNNAEARFVVKQGRIKSSLYLNFKTDSPTIEFEIRTRYKKRTEINRESLVLASALPVNEVYRANRKMDVTEWQEEYWLGTQGVRFGDESNNWQIYHQPLISSMQLQTNPRQLWVNLDYEKDHPFLHFPLLEDTADVKFDWSSSHYKRKTKRRYSFTVLVGANAGPTPRLMKNPNGFLATYIWTEHADFTNIRTNRAVYFGSEQITSANNATGGFVRFGIPVTKSVFYNNPDSVSNQSVSNGQFTELEASIKESEAFSIFLNQIAERGSEISLHTPENFTSNEENMIEALSFMQNRFGSPTWIDHGYNNGLMNNREDLVCDGFIRGSDYYAADLWDRYGIRYLWNPYYEDFLTFDTLKFNQFLDKPYHGFGDRYPVPDYWVHPSRTDGFVHWPTKNVLYVAEQRLWDYYFADYVFDDFIKCWGVEINHCYPPWVDPKKGFWIYDTDSTIVAAKGLNQTLEKMADLRDQGSLNLATIKEFLGYQLAMEGIEFSYLPDGRLRIVNNSNYFISGLSLAVRAKYVLVNDKVPEHKFIADDIIFWFDMEPGTSSLLRLIE